MINFMYGFSGFFDEEEMVVDGVETECVKNQLI